uniref:Uncharacterized protein n=1 Tax=Oryza sativa subsp. japonica TaxID=39947 RepID=Q75H62_ORYSJ|nr:unknown protein [Oryza sativa Japonica Group]
MITCLNLLPHWDLANSYQMQAHREMKLLGCCTNSGTLSPSSKNLHGFLYSTGFEAKILQTGMVSFLLSNLNDGWTGMSFIDTLSPMSRFARSTSIFGGMCSAGQRYTKLVLIFCKKPPKTYTFLQPRADVLPLELYRQVHLQHCSFICLHQHQVQYISCCFVSIP